MSIEMPKLKMPGPLDKYDGTWTQTRTSRHTGQSCYTQVQQTWATRFCRLVQMMVRKHEPHAYMGDVIIGHDAWGIAAKNKDVCAIDFPCVADAFLVVVCKVMCTMIYSHGSLMEAWRACTVEPRMYLGHSREKLPLWSPPLRLQHGVHTGLEHALGVLGSNPLHAELCVCTFHTRLGRDVGLFGGELPALRLHSGCGMVASHPIAESPATGLPIHWVAGSSQM
ncbi:uncharacterized protein G2W53_004603 [Senna tora]|uniref:Uncharacterized protein n=1 Tax=Senna tora TaxID=362788 RepID=A0A834XBY8_9FABA|nr:uncharacterized protein G2W53_004603 [Senna tora]